MSRGSAEIRDYLLGRLEDPARDALEERLLRDADFHAEVREAEYDLYDDYVAGRLNAADRKAFESRMTADTAARVRAARVLKAARRPAGARSWIPLLAACLALSTGLNVWFATRPAQKPVEISGPVGLAVVTVDLTMSTERSGSQVTSFRRQGEGHVFRFRLRRLAAPGAWQAEISGRSGAVWQQAVRGSEIWVPAAVLAPGTYEVALRADGRLVGFSEFRVEE